MSPTDPIHPSTPSPLDSDRGMLDTWRTPLGLEGVEAPAPARAVGWLRRFALLLAALWATLLCVVAVALATVRPWVGVELGVEGQQIKILHVQQGSPAESAGLRPGMRLIAVASPSGADEVVLEPYDLVENPDLLPSYAVWAHFYDRQTRLSRWWAGPLVRLQVQAADGSPSRGVELAPDAHRPFRGLPALFWFLLGVQTVTLMTAAWIWVVYPPRPSTRYASLAALMLSVLLTCAAIFSGRELALPAPMFHALSAINHTASIAALLCLAGVMTYFPEPLPGTRKWRMAAVGGLFALWALANALWWLPSPHWASHAMILSGTALVFVQTARQWRTSATNPAGRAALRALVLPWVVALAGLVGLQEGVLVLGGTPPVSQAWLYGLLFVTTVGGALGLRGARVFEMDDWAVQALLTLGAGIGILLCYRLFVSMQWMSADLATVVAVLVFGITYVPLSSAIWARSILRRGPTPRELTSGILTLGLMPAGERLQQWTQLLAQTLQARSVDTGPPPPEVHQLHEPAVIANGRGLWVPPVADLPGVTLWSRDRGGLLFSRSDRRLVQRLGELVAQTVQARYAYVRGASDERERIADDLHDDLGAKLLSLVHASGQADPSVATQAREALEEMRLAVRNLKAQPLPVADLLADWRAETVSRLTAAGIEVDWDAQWPEDAQLMPVRTAAQLTRVLREAVSNVIRHSGSAHCRVLLHVTPSELQMEIEDNGHGLDQVAVAVSIGHGLPNIERRVRRLGGTHRFAKGALGGTLLMVRVPLELPRHAGPGV